VTVVETDAFSMRLPRGQFRVVASPPYAISSALLSMLWAPRSRLVAADLVLQRAVVRRYTEAGGPTPAGVDGTCEPAARFRVAPAGPHRASTRPV
jgi:16S rRNA A1518/A1519 N6-dimethyltransferase RsmA/KsgA/DIM1 with predicted DNA glycosylase/AP lyase activity